MDQQLDLGVLRLVVPLQSLLLILQELVLEVHVHVLRPIVAKLGDARPSR